jgi:ABC-type Co2+ transport system permease subunit
MSHLHLPDGVVPLWLWAPAWVLAVLLLAMSNRSVASQRVAYQGSLGALMLAAMAVPLGPLEFHLTLAGPVGILLGAAGALPVVFVVSVILAFLGHGGLTVIGLNTFVLAAAAATASVAYRVLAGLPASWAMALGTAAGQIMAGTLWAGIVFATLRSGPAAAGAPHGSPRWELFSGLVLVLWLVGTLIESVVAFGIGRFLAGVHPALLPRPRVVEPEVARADA